MNRPRLTTVFLNAGHTLDHLLMLIFPTVVLAMSGEFGRSYSELLPLALGGFIAFGVGSLPAGWLADRWSRHGMLTVFFVGIGIAAILTGCARTPLEIALGLTLIGLFASIYHPVGIAMLVANEPRVGRALGINGVFGNVGVAFAALTAGALADLINWRAAFIVPGVAAIATGLAFIRWAPRPEKASKAAPKTTVAALSRADIARVFGVLAVATMCGGLIFNATTISMPKVFDERLQALTDTTFGIGALVAGVYLLAAIAQLCIGQLIDRFPLKTIFVPVAAMQAPLLLLAASVDNMTMLVVAIAMMFFVFGLIPINDAMVARYVSEGWRSRVFALRYVVSFGASAVAVPLVALLHETGGFDRVFMSLAAIACFTFIAALAFPGVRATRSIGEAAKDEALRAYRT